MSLSAGSGHPAAFIFIRCCRFAAVIQVMICEKAEERSGQAQFVICDVQREYAENLMNIISEKLKEEYQFHLFWNLQQLKEFSEKMPISRLLIAEEYPVEKRKEILAENRYLLTGKRSQEKEREGEYDWFQEEVPVYRYQSAEIILQKVTGRMELKEKVVADTSVRGMIGVYSPIHRIGKTKFAIRTARQLGRSVPVLYLNLEGNSGDNYYFQNREGNDLGDLLYYMRQDNMNLGLWIVKNGCVCLRQFWKKVFMRSFFWILGTVSSDFIRYWKIAEEFIHRILTRESQRQSWINMKRVCGFPVMEKFFPGQ